MSFKPGLEGCFKLGTQHKPLEHQKILCGRLAASLKLVSSCNSHNSDRRGGSFSSEISSKRTYIHIIVFVKIIHSTTTMMRKVSHKMLDYQQLCRGKTPILFATAPTAIIFFFYANSIISTVSLQSFFVDTKQFSGELHVHTTSGGATMEIKEAIAPLILLYIYIYNNLTSLFFFINY